MSTAYPPRYLTGPAQASHASGSRLTGSYSTIECPAPQRGQMEASQGTTSSVGGGAGTRCRALKISRISFRVNMTFTVGPRYADRLQLGSTGRFTGRGHNLNFSSIYSPKHRGRP
jgi:hypothetical protein